MRYALALLFLMHGIAHFAGFAVPWKLAETPTTHFGTKILGQRIDLGEQGIRLYGVLWLLLALAFAGVALALLMQSSLWYRAAYVVSGISTLSCALSLPHTRVGLWVNLLILAGLYFGEERGWFAGLLTS
jgi:hypothetical protein